MSGWEDEEWNADLASESLTHENAVEDSTRMEPSYASSTPHGAHGPKLVVEDEWEKVSCDKLLSKRELPEFSRSPGSEVYSTPLIVACSSASWCEERVPCYRYLQTSEDADTSKPLQVVVRGLAGILTTLTVDQSVNVSELKRKIQHSTQIPRNEQDLICGADKLHDDVRLESLKADPAVDVTLLRVQLLRFAVHGNSLHLRNVTGSPLHISPGQNRVSCLERWSMSRRVPYLLSQGASFQMAVDTFRPHDNCIAAWPIDGYPTNADMWEVLVHCPGTPVINKIRDWNEKINQRLLQVTIIDDRDVVLENISSQRLVISPARKSRADPGEWRLAQRRVTLEVGSTRQLSWMREYAKYDHLFVWPTDGLNQSLEHAGLWRFVLRLARTYITSVAMVRTYQSLP